VGGRVGGWSALAGYCLGKKGDLSGVPCSSVFTPTAIDLEHGSSRGCAAVASNNHALCVPVLGSQFQVLEQTHTV